MMPSLAVDLEYVNHAPDNAGDVRLLGPIEYPLKI